MQQCRSFLVLICFSSGLISCSSTKHSQFPVESTAKILRPPEQKPHQDPECPIEKDIIPCMCWVLDGKPNLDCSFVLGNKDLAKVFEADFPVKQFNQFILEHNPSVTQLTNIFNGVSFELVILSLDFIMEVTEDALIDSQDTLEQMLIERGSLDADSFSLSLRNYSVLKRLNLKDQQFDYLPHFSSNSLQMLDLPMSNLSLLSPDTFDDIPAITEIGLDFNEFTELQKGWFPLPNRKISIGLSMNEISSVEPGTFVLPLETDKLGVTLFMSYNNMRIIDQDAFGEVFPFVDLIALEENPLECGCDVAWIVLDPEYWSKVESLTTCANGTSFGDLNPQFYIDNC